MLEMRIQKKMKRASKRLEKIDDKLNRMNNKRYQKELRLWIISLLGR